MMKTVRQRIELSGWDAGEGFSLSAPFGKTVRRGARMVAPRGYAGRTLFRSHLTSLGPFEGQGPCPSTHTWRLRIFLVAGLLLSLAVRAQVTNAPPTAGTNLPNRLDYSAFRIISDRNIFNSQRSSRSARSGGEAPRTAKVDSFTLVGTMAYEKGRFAFFDGSGSEYRKVLKPEGVIAGYKILDIAPGNVRLGRDGKELELRVGTQMRRQEEGEWQQTAQAGSYSGSGRSAPAEKADSNGAAAADSGGDENEVLKRLMQKREAEESK
jgi:hypothetical protein